MRKDSDDYINFYYNAGLSAGKEFGSMPDSFRINFINKFMEYVDGRGGAIVFNSSSEAVKSFLYEYKRGDSRGRKRY